MGDHDHSYKLLFAHARMVRELLETFVDELEHWGNRLLEVSSLDDVFIDEQTARL